MLEKDQIQQLIDEYCIQYSKKKNLSQKTVKNKAEIFARILNFLYDKPFTLENLESYFIDMANRVKENGKPLQASSIKTEIANVKAFTKWLFRKKKIIAHDWGTELEAPKIHHRPEPLLDEFTMEAVIIAGTEPSEYDHKLHRIQKYHMRLAMRFALRTGLRAIEILSLSGKDLYLFDGNPRFRVHTKGGSLDWQPFPVDMLEELKERVSWDRMFPVCIDTCNDNLKKGAKLLNVSSEINVHFHMLRKVFGTTLARNGLHMSLVCRLMRHSDISITQKFYIDYGLDEVSANMNTYHSLIRNALPDEKILNFYKESWERVMKNDNKFTAVYTPDGYGGMWVHIVKKEHVDKFNKHMT